MQDAEAAELLSKSLSGYATIRKFYDLRDEEVLLKDGETPEHRPMTRKRIAANALMVVISSAADSIRGGLYDPEVEAVVPVDVLLPLLGEALLFVNRKLRVSPCDHFDLRPSRTEANTHSPPPLRPARCRRGPLYRAQHDTSAVRGSTPHHIHSRSREQPPLEPQQINFKPDHRILAVLADRQHGPRLRRRRQHGELDRARERRRRRRREARMGLAQGIPPRRKGRGRHTRVEAGDCEGAGARICRGRDHALKRGTHFVVSEGAKGREGNIMIPL